MFVILGSSILSSIYMHIADKKNKISYIILAMIVLLIPSTFRDISVGTDVSVYQQKMFSIALRSHGFIEYIFNSKHIVTDYGYSAVVYSASKFLDDIHFLFFVEGLLIIVPIYYVIWNYRGRVDVGITVLTYNMLFYTESYNVVRQYLAISFLVLAFLFCEKKKNVHVVLCVIMGFLLHNSAIVFILLFALYKILAMKDKKYAFCFISIIFIFTALFSVYYINILTMLSKILDFLPQRYFSTQYLHNDVFNIKWINLFIALVNLIILVKVRLIIQEKQWIDFLILVGLLTIGTTYFTASASWSFRIMWYFTVFQIFGFGVGYRLFKQNRINYMIYYLMLLLLFVGNWIYYYVISGNSGIIPYKFM